MRSIALGVASCVLLAAGCASSGGKDLSGNSIAKSPDQEEISIGREIHAQIVDSFYLYTEPRLNEYVRGIMQRVASSAGRALPYDATILVSEKIYAVAAPGGHVYLTTGLLSFIQSEGELAGVLAHEVGHLQRRDPRLSASRKWIEGLEPGAAIAGGFFGEIGMLAVLGLHAINAATDEKPVESRIRTADKLAMKYLGEQGYDPQALIDALARILSLKNRQAYAIFDYCNSRPVDADRIGQLKKDFRKLDLGENALVTRPEEYLRATRAVREMQSAPVV